MAAKKIDNMSDEELMTEWTKVGKEVEGLREKLTEFSKEHQKRERFKQLDLTPGDLELLQGASVPGIESEEKVNKNG